MMKKIKYYLVGLILGASLLISCLDSKLLDTIPEDRLSSATFWKTTIDAEKSVNALYPFLNNDMIWYETITELGSNNSTDASDSRKILEGVQQADLSTFNNEWINRYTAIRASNEFFENVDIIQPVLQADIDLLNRLKGEAHFIRAYAYLYLAVRFGDVPLITEGLTISEVKNIERTPVAEVWKFIFSEFDAAISALPVSYTIDKKGRITKGAAMAFKARAYLYKGTDIADFQEAYKLTKAIIDAGTYQLYPDYQKLFMYVGESSSEVILDKQFIGGGIQNRNQITVPNTLRPGGGGYSCVPTRDLIDLYQTTSGKSIDADPSYDPRNPYENRDSRLKSSIFLNGENLSPMGVNKILLTAPGSGSPDEVQSSNNCTRTGFYMKKYIDPADLLNPSQGGINFILMRYADVMLMAAEGLIESGGDLQEAAGYINLVRTRAGMPGLVASGVNVLSQVEMQKALRYERSVELIFEGLHYSDIIRWKTAETVLKGRVMGMSYVDNTGALKDVLEGASRNFDPDRDYLWPIPSTQMILCPKFYQNKGY